jgi:hypothetical protein
VGVPPGLSTRQASYGAAAYRVRQLLLLYFCAATSSVIALCGSCWCFAFRSAYFLEQGVVVSASDAVSCVTSSACVVELSGSGGRAL